MHPSLDLVAVGTIDGHIHLISIETGMTMGQELMLPAAVFSTPATGGLPSTLFVGCRDNNLYAIQIRISNGNGRSSSGKVEEDGADEEG